MKQRKTRFLAWLLVAALSAAQLPAAALDASETANFPQVTTTEPASDGERLSADSLPVSTAAKEYINIAQGKSAVATQTDGDNAAAKAIDGNAATKWQATMGGANPTLTVDLGSVQAVNQINLVWADNFAFKFKIFTAGANKSFTQTVYMEEGTGGTHEQPFDVAANIQYIKVELITATGANPTIALCELQAMQEKKAGPAEPTNLALKKPATASAVEANSKRLQPAGAFDGTWGNYEKNDNENFRWSSGNIVDTPQWIYVDLETPQPIGSVKIFWEGPDAKSKGSYATAYKLQYASDPASDKAQDASWTDLQTVTGGDGAWDELTFPTVEARYVRVRATAGAGMGRGKAVCMWEMQVFEGSAPEPVNLLLQKPATASAVEGGNKYPQLNPPGAFDGTWGEYTSQKNIRWSSGNIVDAPQWIYADMGSVQTVGAVNIFWEGPDAAGKGTYATDYEIQYATDAASDKTNNASWTTIKSVTGGNGAWDKFTFAPVQARYLRMYATKGANLGLNKAVCIWEMQAYAQGGTAAITIDEAAEDVKAKLQALALQPADTVMPTYSYNNEKITAKLFCSDTDILVNDAGAILRRPLTDKTILATYTVTDSVSGEEIELRNVPVRIPGQHVAGANAKPETVPSLQEWCGAAEGSFALTGSSRIVVSDAETAQLGKAAEITKADILDLFGFDVAIAHDAPKSGDIVLTMAGADNALGAQGYTLTIADTATVSASAYQGAFYGTRSILQALLSSGNCTIAKGTAVDYPKYGIRKFMLDIARKYHPMWYMEDFVKYASWLKFSDFQVHLNDSSYNGHARFRLESDVPGLTATDGYYTKDEYRSFQNYAADHGVRIISEFDMPAHSEVFVNLGNNPDAEEKYKNLGLDKTHLDIRLDSPNKDKVYQFVDALYAEYMGGSNPVFTTDAFNVGLDEYNGKYKEDMTQFTKHVMELVKNTYGKTPLAWASMGCLDTATTKLPDYPIMDAWANYAINLKSLFAQGYQLINATNKFGYIVPGGNNGYPDFANEEAMYNTLSAGYFRDKNGAGITVAEGHPQIVGGSVSLWNDRGVFNGLSTYDVFARQQSIMPIYAQTFWYGREDGETYQQFKRKVSTLGIGPSIKTMSRDVASKTELVYQLDMETTAPNGDALTVSDATENHYNATAHGAAVTVGETGKQLTFAGNGFLSLPHSALQWPYTASFDLTIDPAQSGDIILFQEDMPHENCDDKLQTGYASTKIYLKELPAGYQLMYDREGYHFEHSYVFEKGVAYKIAFQSDKKYSKLFVNGQQKSSINGPILTNNGSKWYDSASINLPLQKLMQNLTGSVDNFCVYNRMLTAAEITKLHATLSTEKENLAFTKPVTVSSLDPAAKGTQNGENAVDGDSATRWTSNRAAGYDLHESIVIDLGAVHQVSSVEIDWEGAAGKEYTVQTSVGGTDYTVAATVTDGKMENRVLSFDPVAARYVKLDLTKKVSNKYGYSLYEIRVFEDNHAELLRTITAVEALLAENEALLRPAEVAAFRARMVEMKAIGNGDAPLTNEALVALKTEMIAAYKAIGTLKPSVTVTPATVTVYKGASQQFTAAVTDLADPQVVWSVRGGTADTTITTGGLLRIAANETAATLTVTAASATNAQILGSAVVTVATSGGSGSSSGSSSDTGKPSVTTPHEGGKVTAAANGTVTITPDSGYRVKDVLVNGKSVGAKTALSGLKSTDKVEVLFEKIAATASEKFTDVAETAWYAAAVQFVLDKGLMHGVSEQLFAPDQTTSRAMITTVLYRHAGSPAVTGGEQIWYGDARAWAMQNGISDGENMDGEITREALVVLLHRIAGLPKSSQTLDAFSDATAVSAWATDAMRWAVETGILSGKTASTLDPTGNATRAEVAAILQRALAKAA